MINQVGYAGVFVKVFDGNGNDITPPKITNFRYMHSEKADDASSIVIESLDPNLPDNPALQENCKIQLLWGYVGGTISGKRSVYIFDIHTSYDAQGVRMELKCYDRLSYLKMTSSTKVHSGTVDDIAQSIADENGLELSSGEASDTIVPGFNTEAPFIRQDSGYVSQAVDNTAVNVRGYIVPQANMSDFKMLRDVLDKKPGGPWVLEGRDDSMIIRTRNFNQTPLRTYKWKSEPGFLLSFVPESKNKSHRASSANLNVSGWNPELKSYIEGDIGQVHDRDAVLNNYVETSDRTLNQTSGKDSDANNIQDDVEQVEPLNSESLDSDTAQEERITESDQPDIEDTTSVDDSDTEDSTTAVGSPWKVRRINTESPAIKQDTGLTSQATDNTAVIISSKIFLKPDLSEKLHTIEQDEEGISAEALNKRKEEELAKNAANAVVIGDPQLVSGKVVTILNVSKKHSGNYYITQVEHVLEVPSGYICNMQLTRNGDNINGPGKVKSTTLDKVVNNTIGNTDSIRDRDILINEKTLDSDSGLVE
jgi:hypothetical protein